jgi:hypothetical protein
MERITIEQSLKFIPIKEDFMSRGIENAEYFTFTPSTHPSYPESEGWEGVNYFTDRLKNVKNKPSLWI